MKMRLQAARLGRGTFEGMAESKTETDLQRGKGPGSLCRWHKSQTRELPAKGGEITEQGREE